MARMRQITVIGHGKSGCTPEHEEIAYKVGAEIARSGSVLVTGGLDGIMKSAAHGAKDAGGITVGIIPQNDFSYANDFCDIVIPSGIGMSRDFLTALSADGIIIVGGGAGKLSEMCAADMHKKPMVAIRNLGGSAEQYIGRSLDHRQRIQIMGADTPEEAVRILLDIITS